MVQIRSVSALKYLDYRVGIDDLSEVWIAWSNHRPRVVWARSSTIRIILRPCRTQLFALYFGHQWNTSSSLPSIGGRHYTRHSLSSLSRLDVTKWHNKWTWKGEFIRQIISSHTISILLCQCGNPPKSFITSRTNTASSVDAAILHYFK